MHDRSAKEFKRGRGCHSGICHQGLGWHRMAMGWPSSASPLPGKPPQCGFFLPGLRAGFFFAYPGHVCSPNRSPRSVRPQFGQSNWSCRPVAGIRLSGVKVSYQMRWPVFELNWRALPPGEFPFERAGRELGEFLDVSKRTSGLLFSRGSDRSPSTNQTSWLPEAAIFVSILWLSVEKYLRA